MIIYHYIIKNMRNQWSFRTKSRLKAIDNSVKISQVIGKKNSSGNPFYPSFTNTTVVLVSEDKRVYETTKATADGNGNLTFLKRWLSDDGTDTEVVSFKKAWMPWTLAFVTIASEDYDKKADISSIPTKTSDLTNDSWFIDNTVNDLVNYTKTSDLWAVATSNDYNDLDNKLTAWANINIDWNNEISATDTTYVASDFDIKDLADSTNLRTAWSWKQDPIIAWTNIQVAADWKTISATDTIPNNATIKVQKNWTDIESFTANESTNKTINITVPVTAADVSALPASTKYWATVDMSINSSTYVVTLTLKDQDWNTLWTAQTIDLPLESVVVSGSYDDVNKKIVLILQSWSTVEFSVADLVSWLQTEITNSNKLSADLVDDSSTTNKFVTASDLTTLSNTSWTNTGDQVASDFDIKDLTDSTWLRTQRSSKQKGVINVEVATGNSTAAKVGTTTAWNYSPAAWDILLVHLKYWNSATAVTLNIDSSGAKAIRIWWELTTTATFTIPNQTDMYVYLMYDWHAYIWYPTKNTTYSASNFDIKDLADSTSLRAAWNWKQDAISDLATIRTWAWLWATAVQPWDDVSDLNNDAWYLTSSDLSWYQTTANMVQDLNSADHDHYPTAKAVQDAITSSGWWDMLAATYDPNNVAWDAFDMDNMAQWTTNKFVSVGDINNWDWKASVIWFPSGTTKAQINTILSWLEDLQQVLFSTANGTVTRAWLWNTAPNAAIKWIITKYTATNSVHILAHTYNGDVFTVAYKYSDWTLLASVEHKQTQLTAWSNITINWTTISATDTTYVASDFDIKDLTDSTNLRSAWNWKQDALVDWTNIKTINSQSITWSGNFDVINLIEETDYSGITPQNWTLYIGWEE